MWQGVGTNTRQSFCHDSDSVWVKAAADQWFSISIMIGLNFNVWWEKRRMSEWKKRKMKKKNCFLIFPTKYLGIFVYMYENTAGHLLLSGHQAGPYWRESIHMELLKHGFGCATSSTSINLLNQRTMPIVWLRWPREAAEGKIVSASSYVV